MEVERGIGSRRRERWRTSLLIFLFEWIKYQVPRRNETFCFPSDTVQPTADIGWLERKRKMKTSTSKRQKEENIVKSIKLRGNKWHFNFDKSIKIVICEIKNKKILLLKKIICLWILVVRCEDLTQPNQQREAEKEQNNKLFNNIFFSRKRELMKATQVKTEKKFRLR